MNRGLVLGNDGGALEIGPVAIDHFEGIPGYPDLVVVAGGVSSSAPLFLDAAREHYGRIVTGAGNRPLARIRTAQLGISAAVVGAATLAREATG